MAKTVQEENFFPVAIGQGMYTAELPSNIPDGFSPVCYNMVASGDSLENRIGIKRSSIDWKVLEIAPTGGVWDSDYYNFFVHLFPGNKDAAKPAFAWSGFGFAVPGAGANTNTLNMVRAGASGAGDGFLSTTVPERILGICQYQDNIYFSMTISGVQKITNINWSTDVVTYTHVVSSAGSTWAGLFTFKDRLWAWGTGTNSHRLYYTEIPSVGGLPETWAPASQFVQFVGPNGRGDIKKIVPLGNRLLVFTSNGLFTLLVEGAPASWILRVLDSKSVSTTSQSAFESKNIVYYVNTQGVWATNGQAATKLSGTIEDQWFLAKGARIHSICPYEDGMIVSVAKLASSNDNFFDKENCRVFYSKIDPIGWTEWNFNRNELGTFPEQLCMIWSTSDKIPTFINQEPSVYVMAFVSDSTNAAVAYAVAQVLVLDGGTDEYVNKNNAVRSNPVGVYFKTKSFDGGNQHQFKKLKKGFIELFTSDAEHDFAVSWDNDFTTSEASEIEDTTINDFTVGVGSNLIPIRAGFQYRRAALNFRATLQSPTSQIKIKDVTIVQEVSRQVHEQVN